MAAPPDPDLVDAVRHFNRFYTARIGALGVSHLESPFSLTEARVLYEVGRRSRATAAELSQALETDPAQMSRTVARLERAGVLARARAAHDGRAQLLTVTTAGKRAFKKLDARSRARVEALLAPLSADQRHRLTTAMRTVERALDRESALPSVSIRPHRAGDLGWIVSRHGEIYAQEYGWDTSFEALVAGIAKEFLDGFDAAVSGCWIAEVDGQRAGAVCLVRHTDAVAKLRLFFVDEGARGHGLGTALVDECVAFARRVGYRTITLWTWNALTAARHVYERAGFHCVATAAPERAFGHDLVFETWELAVKPR